MKKILALLLLACATNLHAGVIMNVLNQTKLKEINYDLARHKALGVYQWMSKVTKLSTHGSEKEAKNYINHSFDHSINLLKSGNGMVIEFRDDEKKFPDSDEYFLHGFMFTVLAPGFDDFVFLRYMIFKPEFAPLLLGFLPKAFAAIQQEYTQVKNALMITAKDFTKLPETYQNFLKILNVSKMSIEDYDSLITQQEQTRLEVNDFYKISLDEATQRINAVLAQKQKA